MGVRVVVELQGLSEVLGNLDKIESKAQEGVVKQTTQLGQDALSVWKNATPKRTGRLAGEDFANIGGLSFTMENGVFYYGFVDEGHMSPRGWTTKHGYRPAKRRSHVSGRMMTATLIDFLEENLEQYLAKFLEGV